MGDLRSDPHGFTEASEVAFADDANATLVCKCGFEGDYEQVLTHVVTPELTPNMIKYGQIWKWLEGPDSHWIAVNAR